MKRINYISLFIGVLIITLSCGRNKGDILTDRIQYDVIINSPESDLEWWVQNLEGNKRERLINSLMDAARSGEQKVYDVLTLEELTPEQIAEKGKRKQLMTLQREDPPYEEYDTLVVQNIELSDISKVRFLEEWYLNQETGKITKKVIAMCPMLESYTEQGELRGHIPLFWISFVKKFPLKKE